jgi:hypothetical protein
MCLHQSSLGEKAQQRPMNKLTVFIPQFFRCSLSALENAEFQALLGKACLLPSQEELLSFEQQLQSLWSWPSSSLPSAALLTHHENLTITSAYHYCAAPVYLQADFSGVFLAHHCADLTEDEADEIQATLNDFLKPVGMLVHRANTHCWYLSCEQKLTFNHGSLSANIGKNVMASGKADKSQQLLTELQMLLHDHPVNVLRREQGKVMVNSLWMWGEGELPAPYSAPFDLVCSNEPLVSALSVYLGVEQCQASSVKQVVESMTKESNAFIVLNDFLYGDHLSDREYIQTMIEQWVLPVRDLLKSNLDTVHLIFGSNEEYQLSQKDGWRFWRKPFQFHREKPCE